MATMDLVFTDEPYLAKLEIMSYMFFPIDESLRQKYLASSLAKMQITDDENGDINIPPGLLALVIDAPSRSELDKLSAQSTKRGVIAGEMFLSLIEMDISNENPSLKKANDLATEYFWSAKDAKGEKSNSSKSSNIRAWNEFKAVSHLWAAHHLIVSIYGHETTPLLFAEEPLLCPAFARDLVSKFGNIGANKHSSVPEILKTDDL